jgi:hypothetical protein
MQDILSIAAERQKRAYKVLEKSGIESIWRSHGSEVNLVGSLKTGLLLNHLDIDLHIYTDPFVLRESFNAIAEIAADKHIKRVSYANLLEEDDECIEWHAWYLDDDGSEWQIDMIHILRSSKYEGKFEKIAQRIESVLTDETRLAILSIKSCIAPETKIPGISIYKAVIRDGIRSYGDFINWFAHNNSGGIDTWIP